MRILAYHSGRTVPDRLREQVAGMDGNVEFRNADYFRGPETGVAKVVTADPDIRDAYEQADVEVTEMPKPGQKNEAVRRRYVAEEGEQGWKKIRDRQTGEYVDGESTRSMEEAKRRADKLNSTSA